MGWGFGVAVKVMPPIGDQAWVTMPRSAPKACTAGSGVDLDLIDCRDHGGALEQRGEVLDHEG